VRSLAGLTAGMLGQGAGLGVLEHAMRAALAAAGARLLEAVLAGESGYRGPRADCGRGHQGAFAGCRAKTVTTVLGPVEVMRAWYHCGQCRRGFAPRDGQLGVAGASLSPGLAEMIARAGADEVDMVIDRGAFLAGRYGQVFQEIRQVREACGAAHLKVILETGELATLDNVSRAAWLAMLAGADFIKTSTGKVTPAATPPVTLVMLAAVRDYAEATGCRVGVKVAGGVRTAKDAIRYLVLVRETAGPQWLTPELFRIGASSLLNDLLMQRAKQLTGAYAGPDYFSID